MYLKRLELQGYKTFATKTEFEFDAGITAIIGPNGSGKSNIADAIRWVMGEQRYRTLRAKRSDDMIFAGGQGRSRVGMAEVSLTLDNSAGWLPIDYSEVTVQRRTYRSGENQYLLNGSRARRRDIVELLAKGGVSSNTYTIIGQGTVDASLGMKPEERRLIFEEAAGIAIHQAKRDQALRKLEDTGTNILRVNDIVSEIAPRLQRLSKQAERAREYQEASKRLESLLETWYGYRWRRAQGALRAAQEETKRREETLSEQNRRREEISRQIDEVRKLRAELRGQLGDWHSESGELHRRLEGLQREFAVKEERQRLTGQRRHEIQQELAPLNASLEARLQRIAELESELEHLSDEHNQRDAEWQAAQGELKELEARRQELERQVTANQEIAFELATGLADLRNRLDQFRDRRRDIDREREEHAQAGEEITTQLAGVAERIAALESELSELADQRKNLENQVQQKQQEVQTSADQQEQLKTRLSGLRQEVNRLQVRDEVLTKARTELADYSEAVRTVLTQRKALGGLVATVGELIQVPAELERAIGAALGHLLQAIVVEGWEDARAAIGVLTQSNAGRATFLPLDSLTSTRPKNRPGGSGVLGLAADLVGVREGLESVPDALLGSTVVVEDLQTARRVRADRADLACVTLSGELVSESGALAGGSDASGSVLLAHERERRELPQQIAALRHDERALQGGLDQEERRHRELEHQLASMAETHTELDKASSAKNEEISSWRLKQERAAQELEWHKVTASRLLQEVETLHEKERSIGKEIETSRQKERETSAAVTSLQEQLETLDVSPLQERLGGLRTAIAVLQRSRESQETALGGHRAGLEQIEAQLEDKELRVAELGAEADELATSVTSLAAQVEELAAQADGLSSRIAEGEERLAALERQQADLEEAEGASRRKLQDFEAAHNGAILKRQRCEDELRNLQERIEADLETVAMSTELPKQLTLDIDARLRSLPVITEVPRGLDAEIKHLRQRLRQLGPVDLEAMEEYEQVVQRHGFLVGQIQDLEEAARSLRKVVAELDRVMKDKFVETFESISVEFEGFFARLFNGGQASIHLTDPDDPLQSGVEILAQPPGRRARSIAMLSGGERALTGVALTFAILTACRTPFCFLDEIDSRLDEVNVARVGDSLRELSDRTQLVVITHNRATLEKAHSIYGITMSADGASRVLSLRLEEAEKRAAQTAAS
jgi:chromosome segregation protein